jgi:hypothetical protein
VKPNLLSQTLDPATNILIQDFCDSNSTQCPDGAIPSATKLDKNGTNKVADGSSYYDFILKPRDRYGNRVNMGSIDISYTGSISNIQLPGGIFSTLYIS